MDAYAAWIAANCPDPTGRCAEYTAALAAAFPDLTRVRGGYCYDGGTCCSGECGAEYVAYCRGA